MAARAELVSASSQVNHKTLKQVQGDVNSQVSASIHNC